MWVRDREVKACKALIDELSKMYHRVDPFKHRNQLYYATNNWFHAVDDEIFKISLSDFDYAKGLEEYDDTHLVTKVELCKVDGKMLYRFSNEKEEVYVSSSFKKVFGDPTKTIREEGRNFKICGKLLAVFNYT